MIIEAGPKRTSEQPLIISLQNGRNLSFPDKKWYRITQDIALALDDNPRNTKRQLDRIIENDPNIEITTVGKLRASGRASELERKEQYKTIICNRENLIKIMQAYTMRGKVNGQPHKNSPEDLANPTDAVSEEWWKDNMPDPNQSHYTTEDLWNVLKQQEGKENITHNYVSLQVRDQRKALGISGKSLSKTRALFYKREDAQKIMSALLALEIGKNSKKNPNNPLSNTPTIVPFAESIRTFSDGQDEHEKDPEKISTDDIKNIKKQLIEAFTDLILSQLTNNPDGLDDLGHKPHMPLINTLRLISKNTVLNQIIPMEELERFFAESFAERLEEVWNKLYNSRQSGKEQRTIGFCNELHEKGKTKEEIIQIVCGHFSVPIPEKSDNKQYSAV